MLFLTAETVQGSALSLQRIDHVHGGDGFPLGVLGVSDSIPDNVLEENFENSTGLFVNETGYTFHTTTTSQTTDGGFCDALDVIAKNFTMSLRSSFAQTFSSLASTRHVEFAKSQAEMKGNRQ
jgi:hypothetical protein